MLVKFVVILSNLQEKLRGIGIPIIPELSDKSAANLSDNCSNIYNSFTTIHNRNLIATFDRFLAMHSNNLRCNFIGISPHSL